MNLSQSNIIISVDFDGTLALGNKSHITLSEPNRDLIKRIKDLKKETNCYIKIVTARGGKNKLTLEEKKNKYENLIKQFCEMYEVPYNEISFSKEYADLYIDDMTINQFEDFNGIKRPFTKNSIIFTEEKIIKKCATALFEKEWYATASKIVKTPEVLFLNDQTIILSRIRGDGIVDIDDMINLLNIFKENKIHNFNFQTYIDNIKIAEYASEKVKLIAKNLPHHNGTFFHGDFCREHILKKQNELFLIDPNYKNIFGSYITDAGKAFFSLIAYDKNYKDAKKISDSLGEDVIKFAVAEGLRVCKYNNNYISIVNNIADIV
jgi:biopolymer transport protein ExbD